jgi:8-oxo-dGTP diphosphatase
LLFKGVPASGDILACWFCRGGGLETGEGYEQAARRELFEETGIVAEELGPVVLERTVRFAWDGVEFDQTEHYFVVRTSARGRSRAIGGPESELRKDVASGMGGARAVG